MSQLVTDWFLNASNNSDPHVMKIWSQETPVLNCFSLSILLYAEIHIWSVVLFVLYPEKDVNGDALWVWCYPSVSSDLRQVLLSKCCLTQGGRDFHTFVFGQFCRTWYYITTVEVQEPTALNKVEFPESLGSFRSWTRNNERVAFLCF